MTKSFEILVSCDPCDQSGSRIQWSKASPSDNTKCSECHMWTAGGYCECEWEGEFEDGQAEFFEEPIHYRNGIIMKLKSSSDGEGIQVEYVKNPTSYYFCNFFETWITIDTLEINRQNKEVV